MCVVIAWHFCCKLGFGVFFRLHQIKSTPLVKALIDIFGKALFGLDALISDFSTDIIDLSRFVLRESMNAKTELCFEVDLQLEGLLGRYVYRKQLHFANGNMWGGKCQNRGSVLWINPLVGQMVLSPSEPEGLAVNINMGAHPLAFPSHVSSLSQCLPVPDFAKTGSMRCQKFSFSFSLF